MPDGPPPADLNGEPPDPLFDVKEPPALLLDHDLTQQLAEEMDIAAQRHKFSLLGGPGAHVTILSGLQGE